ncbi:MAG: MFS transporter [Hyphomicrobium sp.]
MYKKIISFFKFNKKAEIPRGIWVLGFVSLSMDISSEMIHALLPIYLVTVLGTSTITVGIIEGVAEAATSVTKVFSGALSDWLGKRKFLTSLGYGLAAVTKPIFPLASDLSWFISARLIDRIGKGIRGAPRDALIADLSPDHLRGASFGLRQSLDTIGAFLGPALAILLLLLFDNDIKIVFWGAVLPAFIAVFLVIWGISEPDKSLIHRKIRFPLHFEELKRLEVRFWIVVAIAEIFTLARFSEAFLLLKVQSLGLSLSLVPATLIIMNIFYALASYPAGVLSDNNGDRFKVLIIGLILLIISDLVLASSQSLVGVALGVILWGLHMGFSQGVLSALIADTAPPELRGTAFGIFNLLMGLAVLLSSVIAGLLWDTLGSSITFLAGALFASLSLLGVRYYQSRFKQKDFPPQL